MPDVNRDRVSVNPLVHELADLFQMGTASATGPGPVQLCAERADAVSLGNAVASFLAATAGEMNVDGIAVSFADRASDCGADGKFVGSVSQRHERTVEWVSVHGARYFDKSPGSENLCRIGKFHACPRVAFLNLPQGCGEADVEGSCCSGHGFVPF